MMTRYRLLFFILVILFIGDIGAQNQVKTNSVRIEFENYMHDFGVISKNADCSCVFKFKNRGEEPLIISTVITSCGCTTPLWTKEPIKKGQTGEILVTYDSNRVGKFSKSITVMSNAKSPVVILKIRGTIEN